MTSIAKVREAVRVGLGILYGLSAIAGAFTGIPAMTLLVMSVSALAFLGKTTTISALLTKVK